MKQRYAIYGNDTNTVEWSAYIRTYAESDLDTPEKIKSIIDKFWNSTVLLNDKSFEFVSTDGKDGAIICFAKGKNILKTYGIILPETHPSFNNLITLLQRRKNKSKTTVKDIYDAFDADQKYRHYKQAVYNSIFP